jgi:hypothetical protein
MHLTCSFTTIGPMPHAGHGQRHSDSWCGKAGLGAPDRGVVTICIQRWVVHAPRHSKLQVGKMHEDKHRHFQIIVQEVATPKRARHLTNEPGGSGRPDHIISNQPGVLGGRAAGSRADTHGNRISML